MSINHAHNLSYTKKYSKYSFQQERINSVCNKIQYVSPLVLNLLFSKENVEKFTTFVLPMVKLLHNLQRLHV